MPRQSAAYRSNSRRGTENGEKKERNDRLVAVAEESCLYGHIRHIDDFEESFLRQLESFFVNYHSLDGPSSRVVGKCGPAEARKLLKRSKKMAKK